MRVSVAGATLAEPAFRELDEVLRARALRPVFQPLIDLRSGSVLGFESLIRGPLGSAFETPAALFGAAGREDRLADLDSQCRLAAFEAAADGGLGGGLTLFVNLEPGALSDLRAASLCPPPGLRVVIEITERALTSEPASLLRTVAHLRRQGFGIAVDDVGADSRSLALMPFLRPDVIKLDLRLVQQRPSVDIARILAAVSAQSESTGAVVVAEGVETGEQVGVARSLGASIAQGFHFGRPGPLPTRLPAPGTGVPLLGPLGPEPGPTPFEVLRRARPVQRGTKPLLRSISRSMELEATALGHGAVVIATFQDEIYFTPRVRKTYRTLGRQLAFTGVLGAGLSNEPEPGVRGGTLPPGDPLRREWDVAVIGPHFAATLAAWDVGDLGPENQRRFDFAVSHDRDLAIEAARSMMLRIAPDANV